jgi:hypothetical protein
VSETQDFPIGDVLSLTTGRLLSRDGMEGVQRICEFMAGEPVWTHQLPRIMEEAGPRILVQHPDLAAIDVPVDLDQAAWPEWMTGVEARYGATRTLTQLADDESTSIDPLTEMAASLPQETTEDGQ